MSERFAVFHLDSERGFRGGERQLLYLARHLLRRGHGSVVACRPGSPLEARARTLGLETLALAPRFEWDWLGALRLRREALRAGPPVLLHAHTGHTAALALLAGLKGRLPSVVHRRVDFHLSPLGRLKYARAERVIAVSREVRRVLAEDGVPEGRIEVLPDCLPLTDEEAEGWGPPLSPPSPQIRAAARTRLGALWRLPEEDAWIGALAALVPHKDHATLLRSVPRLLALRPKARFILAGDGPLRAELEATAERLGVLGRVLFTGFQEDVRPWLEALDLLVLSSWGEGMGSVLLEAMASGLPIVATRAGGIPEVLQDGESALLVAPRDPEALALALAAALGDGEASRRRAGAAREALAAFSLGRVGDKMIELYESVLFP